MFRIEQLHQITLLIFWESKNQIHKEFRFINCKRTEVKEKANNYCGPRSWSRGGLIFRDYEGVTLAENSSEYLTTWKWFALSSLTVLCFCNIQQHTFAKYSLLSRLLTNSMIIMCWICLPCGHIILWARLCFQENNENRWWFNYLSLSDNKPSLSQPLEHNKLHYKLQKIHPYPSHPTPTEKQLSEEHTYTVQIFICKSPGNSS